MTSIDQRIDALSIKKQALLRLLMEEKKKQQPAHAQRIPARGGTGPAPLSFPQQRLWFLHRLDPDNVAYNIPAAVRLTGAIDPALLERSVNEIIRRHESLRTVFSDKDGEPMQIVQPELAIVLERIDLRDQPETEREAAVYQQATREVQKPFNLERGPLLRMVALQMAENEYVVLMVIHHIVGDVWSVRVFIRELLTIYQAFAAGQPSPLPALPLQYADFALWQRDWLSGAAMEQQLAYWREQLEDAPKVLELPIDKPRPPVQSFWGAKHDVVIDRELTDALREFSRREGVSLYMTLVAAFKTLLHRYTGVEQMVIGTPIANRTRAELEGIIGFLINSLALRTDMSGDPSFRELVQRVRGVTLGAFANQDLPFERLVTELQVERDMSRNPLYQVMFILQNLPSASLEMPGISLQPVPIATGTTQCDLMLDFFEQDGMLTGWFDYDTDLFEVATIARLEQHLLTLLRDIVADPNRRLSQLEIMPAPERALLLETWNATGRAWPAEPGAATLVEHWATQTPQATAAIWQDERLSYGELDRRANRLAHALRARGVGPEARVGICLERSLELIVGVLAVWKAGGAYVPLDPNYPAERLAFMVRDSRPQVILTRRNLCALLPESDAALLCLDESLDANVPGAGNRLPCAGDAHNLAYVVYTSGSTDTPKGVLVEQRSLINAYRAWQEAYALGPGARHLQMASFSFDVFAGDLLRALCSGGTLVICPRDLLLDPPGLLELIRRVEPHYGEFVPVVIRELLQRLDETGQRLDGLECLIVGSDVWYGDEYRRLQGVCGKTTRLINSYGVSEVTIDSTFFEGPQCAPHRVVPIGRPFANTQVYILDRQMQPAPIGVAGELYLGGAGLARGYLGRPDLTAERFVPNPFATTDSRDKVTRRQGDKVTESEEAITVSPLHRVTVSGPEPALSKVEGVVGGRLYRTGDLARYLPDGNIEFLGRDDAQVKIRGFRIELGEIESALLQHATVREAVVLARQDRPGDARLVAYLTLEQAGQEPGARNQESVLEDGGWKIEDGISDGPGQRSSILHPPSSNQGELRAFLKDKLPDYMVPSLFVTLPALPLTANGKIDRRALPQPSDQHLPQGDQYVAPRSPVEERLAEIWAELLRADRVGVTNNFFELGGHSLLITQLVSRIRIIFRVELPVRSTFEAPTVAGMAAVIERLAAQQRLAELPPILPANRAQPLPLSFAQERLWVIDQILPGSAAYNIPGAVRLRGALDLPALERTFDTIIRRHDVFRTTFATLDSKPVQVIAPPAPFRLDQRDLGGTPAADREAYALRLALDEAQRPFDLAQGPLIRVRLLRLHDRDHLLVMVMHHIIYDMWSREVFIPELLAIYAAFSQQQPMPLPELSVQYADFAAWQRQWLRGELLDAQLDYWKHQLAGAPFLIALPTDRPYTTERTFASERQYLTLSASTEQALRRFSQASGATLFMTMLAAFAVLLARYSGQSDLLVGTPIAGRNRAEIENLIGFFVNTLVLRADLAGAPTFRGLLQRVRTMAIDAYDRADLPFELLVNQLAPERDVNRHPLFQVFFNFLQNYSKPHSSLPDLQMSIEPLHNGATKFELNLTIMETEDGLRGTLDYSCELFDDITITRMLEQFTTLLDGIAHNPDRPIERLPLVSAGQQQQILEQVSTPTRDFGPAVCLHQLFARQAGRTPAADAVIDGDRVLSFAMLERQANQLAHTLRRSGVGPDVPVAILCARSAEMIVALLGTLKAGGAYLPLDPAVPPQRLRRIIADARPALLLTAGLDGLDAELHAALAEHGSAGAPALRAIDLRADWPVIAAEPGAAPPCDAMPDHLAYMIYTSGSTGQPKGVAVAHRSVVNLAHALANALSSEPQRPCRVSLNGPLSFDTSVKQWIQLLAGHALVVIPEEIRFDAPALVAFVRTQQIDVLDCTPAQLRLLVEHGLLDRAQAVPQRILVGGEAIDADLWQMLAAAEDRTIVNLYGPTECTVDTTLRLVDGPVPALGGPLANVQVYLLDAWFQPVPPGVPGEIYIGGAGLARGYLNRPDLTAERFIPNPFATTDSLDKVTRRQGDKVTDTEDTITVSPLHRVTVSGPRVVGSRLYKTGDRARLRNDGELEFLGRVDQQVKLRGYRIELGEIAAALRQHPDVADAVAVVRASPAYGPQLIGYFVPREGASPVASEVRGFVRGVLPEYMVPSMLVSLAEMPLTAHGKLDRRALEAQEIALRPAAVQEPRTPTEVALAAIWAELLRLERIGVDDNFFEIGGHSLLATQVMSRLRATFRLDLPLRVLFEHSNLAALARYIDVLRQAAQDMHDQRGEQELDEEEGRL